MIYCNTQTNKGFGDPFLDMFFGTEPSKSPTLSMKTDIYESEKAYRLEMNLPGCTKENIKLSYKEGYLTINVTAPTETKDEEFKLIRHERFQGAGARQFYLGDLVEKEITANFENGVLTIVAPKLLPVEEEPYSIEIK